MKEDDHATNVSTPSTTKVGKQTLKPSTEASTSSASILKGQDPGEFNIKCGTCNRIIAMDMKDKSEVDQLLDQHQKGTECDEATVSMVLPQEVSEEPDNTSTWDKIPGWALKEAVIECEDETRQEIADKLDKVIE